MSENAAKKYFPLKSSVGIVIPIVVAIVVLMVVVSFFFISIPRGKIGIVYVKQGKTDPESHFIVEKGYKGTQREVLMPGWKFTPKMFLDIKTVEMTIIPKGKVGVLIAQDGRNLAEGAVLAADDEYEAATKTFRMGEKGIRKSILEPGTYPINTQYFTVELHDAINIEPGKVGVLTRKIGDPAPSGQILVSRDSPYRGIIRELLEPGIQYLHPYVYQWQIIDALTIPAGKVGVLTRKVGNTPPAGSILVDRDSEYQGIIRQVLEPGMFYINPYEFQVEQTDAVAIADGFIGVMIAKTGKAAPEAEALVAEGFRGIRKDYLKPGLYYVNPYEFDIVPIETRQQKYEMTYIQNEGDTNFADEITFLSNDGFQISIDVTIMYEVQPENAPYVVATLGKDTEDIKDKIIRPGSRSFARLEGSMLKAIDFVTGETRKTFQEKLAAALHQEGARAKINILNTFVRGYKIPEELLAPVRFKEIALKEREQIIEEQKREEEKAKLAKQQALVEQEGQKIRAETGKLVAETKAEEDKQVAIIKGEQMLEVAKLDREAAEQEKLRQIALGEGEARRRQLLIEADNLEELRLTIYKEVMTTFAAEMGKQKWVPDMIIGGQSGGSGTNNAITDVLNLLSGMVANQLRLQEMTPQQSAPAGEVQP